MRLVKGTALWVGERRGKVVFHRGGKVSAPGVPKSREFKNDTLAQRFLEAERDKRLAEGFVLVDPEAGLDTPFTPDGAPRERKLSPRYAALGDAVRLHVRAGYLSPEALDAIIDQLAEDALSRNRAQQTASRRAAMTMDERLFDERIADVVAKSGEEPPPSPLAESLREVARAERAAINARTPPSPCINDALDAAFAALTAQGIVALQAAGYTQSDGWGDANEEATRRRDAGEPVRGACFFHEQDVERAVKGQGLLLSFGAYGGDAVEVGRLVVSVLRAHGVPVEWNETEQQRIQVLPFPWFRRP